MLKTEAAAKQNRLLRNRPPAWEKEERYKSRKMKRQETRGSYGSGKIKRGILENGL